MYIIPNNKLLVKELSFYKQFYCSDNIYPYSMLLQANINSMYLTTKYHTYNTIYQYKYQVVYFGDMSIYANLSFTGIETICTIVYIF